MAVPLRPESYRRPILLPSAQPQRVADLMVETLGELGVNTYFGVPGGAISSMYDALLDAPDQRVINTRHETGAVYMGIGHYRAGGGLPAILTTAGPGIINALTGLAAAQADGIPMLMIGGEVPRKNFGRGALQEGSRYHLDVLGMVRSVTKFSAEVSNPRAAVTTVRKAVATALSGRQGPVFLSLPLDVANERVMPTRASTHVATSFDVDEEMIDQAVRALQGARRGMILAGSGARHPEAVRLIGNLATCLQIPVATTPKAKGLFPETDPLSLGIFGLAGHTSATRYLEQGIDVLLVVGAGLGEQGTNAWSPLLQPKQTFIQVDIDAAQIGKNYQVDVGLVGPAHVMLQNMLTRIRHRPHQVTSNGGVTYHQPELLEADTVPLQPPRVIAELQKLLPADTLYTADMGEHTLFTLHYLKVDRPDGFICSMGLGALGSGIGAAVGAKVGQPSRPVAAICGDYGMQMHGMEVVTCVEQRLGVVFAVFNDARMRMVENGQKTVFGRSGHMEGPRVDFAAMARSMGAKGYTIRTPEDFQALPRDLAHGDVPVVLDIEIDPNAAFALNGRLAQIKHFNGEE